MNDKLLREKLRVERDLRGEAHPFIALSIVVKSGEGSRVLPAVRENPYTRVVK